MSYPVSFYVEHPAQFSRLQLALRIVGFCALGVFGLSFSALLAFAYLALPVFAAVRLRGTDPAVYLERDGKRIIRGLHWLAAICSWFGLVVDRLPEHDPSETVRLIITTDGHPSPATAAWRLVTALPSAVVLALLGWLGSIIWVWAALSSLISERVGDVAFGYLVGLQRWSIRLLAYQASLIDEYPPFSFEDDSVPTATIVAKR